MARFRIIDNSSPYYQIEVAFGDQSFTQSVMFQEQGERRDIAMQAYADRYEKDWLEAQQLQPAEPEAGA